MFRGDPDFNQIELKKFAATKAFDMDDDELKILLNPNPDNQAMMGGAPVGDVADGAQVMPPAAPPIGVPGA